MGRSPSLLLACLLAPLPAMADELTSLINAYRAVPRTCAGRTAAPAPPLAPHPALAAVHIGTGTMLEPALERLGYAAARADAIVIEGADDARSAMASIAERYCRTLLSTDFSAIGVARHGGDWQIVLAQPVAPLNLPPWQEAGRAILDAVNAARAAGRQCGERWFAPAPPLSWNEQLANAALAHSTDMARQHYFDHRGKDGAMPAERATRAGYRWRAVGENIAAGQTSAAEAVAGWLASPGHCANLMNPRFLDTGAAYAVRADRPPGRVVWAQEFGVVRD